MIVTHDPTITRRTDQTVILSDGEIIDETVARTLPFLDHQQMLMVTHNLRKHVYPPGSSIIYQGEPIDHFFMIDRGEVTVTVNTKIPETTVAKLGPGQFFGEVSLTLGGNAISGVRAGDQGPVELSSITKRQFLSLIRQSPSMESTLQKVAQLRMSETQTLLRGIEM